MSRPAPADVSHLLMAHYINPDSETTRYVPRRVFMDWWRSRPFTVLCTFQDTDRPKKWLVSRELLGEGLYGPAGAGDAQLFPSLDHPGCVELVLSSPYGRAGVLFARSALHQFLTATYELVPVGAEVLPQSWFEQVTRS